MIKSLLSYLAPRLFVLEVALLIVFLICILMLVLSLKILAMVVISPPVPAGVISSVVVLLSTANITF